MSVVDVAGRLLVGSVFLVAGVGKQRRPFAEVYTALRPLFTRRVFARIAARVAPPAEIVVGVGVLLGSRAAFAGAVALGAALTVLAARVVARGLDVPCACFGATRGHITGVTVARNGAITAVALVSAVVL